MSKGNAKKVRMCGRTLYLGDWVKVEYTTGERMRGGTIQGRIIELWDTPHRQARVDSGWCFHDHDLILDYTEGDTDSSNPAGDYWQGD